MIDKPILHDTLASWLAAHTDDPQPAQPSAGARAVAEAFGFNPDALTWTTERHAFISHVGLTFDASSIPTVWCMGGWFRADERSALSSALRRALRPSVVTVPATNTTLVDTYSRDGYVWRQTVVNNGLLIHVLTLPD